MAVVKGFGPGANWCGREECLSESAWFFDGWGEAPGRGTDRYPSTDARAQMSTVLENGTREHYRRRWAALFTRLVCAGLEAQAAEKARRFINSTLIAELARALHAWEGHGEAKGFETPLAGLAEQELALRAAALGYAAARERADAAAQEKLLEGLMAQCFTINPRRRA